MYRFSIVVPMLGSSSLFEATLASILRYRPDACQVIVAHDGSYNDPHGLAEDVEFVSTTQPTNLIGLFNRGLEVAKGEFVSLIRPGVELQENWDSAISDAFADEDVGSVTPAIVSSSKPANLVAAGVSSSFKFSRKRVGTGKRLNSRRLAKIKPLAPTSWAAFYRRSLLTALGDCDQQLDPHYLDVDLGLSLQNLKFDCVFRPDCVVTVDDESLIANEFRLPHGKSAERALTRHRTLSASQRLARTTLATLTDLLTTPFSLSNLKHALQRLGAIRLRSNDRHHMDLLKVLNKQRPRLVTRDSQSREKMTPTTNQRAGTHRTRRAA
jgi:cellulose synthase/poly-beta-1,6-N-acetylglucosamine synthase-like glycosyltransferase